MTFNHCTWIVEFFSFFLFRILNWQSSNLFAGRFNCAAILLVAVHPNLPQSETCLQLTIDVKCVYAGSYVLTCIQRILQILSSSYLALLTGRFLFSKVSPAFLVNLQSAPRCNSVNECNFWKVSNLRSLSRPRRFTHIPGIFKKVESFTPYRTVCYTYFSLFRRLFYKKAAKEIFAFQLAQYGPEQAPNKARQVVFLSMRLIVGDVCK